MLQVLLYLSGHAPVTWSLAAVRWWSTVLPSGAAGEPGDAVGQCQRCGRAGGGQQRGPAIPKVHRHAAVALWVRAPRWVESCPARRRRNQGAVRRKTKPSTSSLSSGSLLVTWGAALEDAGVGLAPLWPGWVWPWNGCCDACQGAASRSLGREVPLPLEALFIERYVVLPVLCCDIACPPPHTPKLLCGQTR